MRYRFMRFPEGKGKAVTLSYDDGCRQDIRFAQTIDKYGLKCTFNLNSDKLREVKLTDSEIEEHFLSKKHEIAVHGAMHRANGLIRPIEGIKDILECRLELEKRFGRIIRGMAYPDCGILKFVNSNTFGQIKQYLKEMDIVYARTLGGDNNNFNIPEDFYAWMPTAHHDNPDIFKYIDEFLNVDLSVNAPCAARESRLFYMWGHTYEFDNNNNWDLLDKICDKLGNRQDIWYATNMDIYNYVEAYNSLVYNAEGNMIYNPTLYEVWLDIDGEMYSIKSGETLIIND